MGVELGNPDAVRCPCRMALTPALPGYLPVNKAARDGLHTGLLEYQSVKRTPSAAIRSRFGVRKSVAPMHDRSPYPWSSVMNTMTLGRSFSFDMGDDSTRNKRTGAVV